MSFEEHTPSILLSFTKIGGLRGVVKKSAIWSSLLQNTNSITPFLHKSRRKWNLTSICLLLLYRTGFLDSLIAKKLSQYIKVGSCCWLCRTPSSLRNQIALHELDTTATNSALVVDSAIICCFFDDQVTAPELIINTEPDVLFLSSRSLA